MANLRSSLLSMIVATAVSSTSLTLAPAARAADHAAEGKRHFLNGVRLFEDRNLAGALVDFEVSYAENPTAAAAQNIAVCQKGLFRYADAIGTLEKMLKRFSLSPEDKKAAEDAIRDMSLLLGTVVIKVTPREAKVTLNGEPLAADALAAPVRLAAGEYRVAAEAAGYEPEEKAIAVVSGQKDVPVEMMLRPVKPAPAAADQPAPSAPAEGAVPLDHGIYGLFSLGGGALVADPPAGLSRQKPRAAGGFVALRGGYRFTSLFAAELDLALSTYAIDACRKSGADCTSAEAQFHLNTTRVGPAARFMTDGPRARIVGSAGFGIAAHSVNYDPALLGPGGESPDKTSGVGSYFELAGGYELTFGHLLLAFGLRLLAENAQKVGLANVGSVGLEVAVGYAQW